MVSRTDTVCVSTVAEFEDTQCVVASGYSCAYLCKIAGNGEVVMLNGYHAIAVINHHRVGVADTFVGTIVARGK